MTHLKRARSDSSGTGTPPATAADWATLISAAVLAPMVVRVTLLVEAGIHPGLADARGFLADIAISLLVAAGLTLASRSSPFWRWFGVVSIGAWSLLNFANYEHIRELGSIVNLFYVGYAADGTFLLGSALAPTHLALTIVTGIAAMVLAGYSTGRHRAFRVIPIAMISILLTISVAVSPMSLEAALWRQSDLLTDQLGRLINRIPNQRDPRPVAASRVDVLDLDGAPIAAFEPRARNVLLVILEGVSGGYLPSLREVHGAPSSITMPRLDAIAREGLAYSTFVAIQRQTNRGEYAILCGDYPKLVTGEAKMSEVIGQGPLECLPAAMRDAHHSTTYLQASPLPFMMKDQFLPQAGFDTVLGDRWFQHAYNRNHWGVDDRSFFEQALILIDELDQQADPWFLTLLTVGTHHPYNAPEDFESEFEPGSAGWAFDYLDSAIGSFVSKLGSTGILDDTLVLIVSDESQAKTDGAPDPTNMLSQAWGFLIALTPSKDRAVIDEVFCQADIPVSVLDYLDLESRRDDFTGRSVFRRYDRGRSVFWGNTYLGLVAGLSPDHDLTICTDDFTSCGTSQQKGQALFTPDHRFKTAEENEIEPIRTAAHRSRWIHNVYSIQRNRTLIASGRHPVTPDSAKQYVFGGQYLTLPAHSRTDVEIVFHLEGEAGWIDFAHNYMVNHQPRLAWSNRVHVGEKLTLSYSLGAESTIESSEFRLWITAADGEHLSLDFEKAHVTISPVAAAQSIPESETHAFTITDHNGKTRSLGVD